MNSDKQRPAFPSSEIEEGFDKERRSRRVRILELFQSKGVVSVLYLREEDGFAHVCSTFSKV